MRIQFRNKYKSISEFNELEVADFSVFLGMNGSGKTHLLRAIQEGSVEIPGIKKEEISYFNYQTFLIKNQKRITPRTLDDERLQAWQILESQRNRFEEFDKSYKATVGHLEYPYSMEVSDKAGEKLVKMRDMITSTIDKHTPGNAKLRKLLKSGIFDSPTYASELQQADFFKYASYEPDDYELLESLSEVFLSYQKKLALARLPTTEGGDGLDAVTIESMENAAPWHFVNTMFQQFGLPHTISRPKFTAGDLINSQTLYFQVKLSVGENEIDFDDLSSGEKILCALAITVYQDSRSTFPKVLLLDEIDASLHPSMIEHLLEVIEGTFLRNNCKVILATHSPTTVALVDEGALFEVCHGTNLNKISKVSQKDAINLLSEGIMTFDAGIRLQSSIDTTKQLQIITEGNNTEHIRKALTLLDSSLLNKITIIEGAPGQRGQQLKNAYDVLCAGYLSDRFLFVWDCDFSETYEHLNETAGCYKFCFAENTSNTKAHNREGRASGIENLYPDELFTDDVYDTSSRAAPYGGRTNITEFNKQKFLAKIQLISDVDTFANFRPLAEKIRSLTSDDAQNF